MKYILGSICLLLFARGYAQVSSSTFLVQSTTVYLTTIGGTLLGDTSSDDQIYLTGTTGTLGTQSGSGFPIGFSFTYNGSTYTRFGVSNNGYIKLGNLPSFTMTSNGYYQDIQATGDGLLISALNYDLQGQTGSALTYVQSGFAPSRMLTIQWLGYRSYNQTGDIFNFQIRLYEDSSKVEFCYGVFAHNSTSETARVGLYGNNNSDFFMRTHISNWATTNNGGANSSSIAFNGACVPPVGLTFTYYPTSVLPVTYISFDAGLKEEQVKLNWTTASEIQNDFFTIERSADGLSFEEIGKISGAGTSLQMHSYTFIDAHPNSGINYYRLKQTDFNGDYTYSIIKPITILNQSDISLKVFPNPANTSKQVTIKSGNFPDEVPVIITISDAFGKQVFIQEKAIRSGLLTLTESDLAPGIYFFEIESVQTAQKCSGRFIVSAY